MGVPFPEPFDTKHSYCQSEYMPTLKDDRLQIRLDLDDKRLLERAARASHLSVSAFVLQAASAHAEEVLAERHSILLSPEAATAFADALDKPAQVNQRLRAALETPRNFTWID